MPSELLKKQQEFALAVANLILKANQMGYKVTLGEAYRSPETAKIYAEQGRGIKNSLHSNRLAVDICLFKEDRYLKTTEEYEPLGIWWESIGGTWGGRFQDGNHFSFEYNGVK